ncbi:hypothetical protein CAOG_06714 [Capsaspora owczarzaki ATCC 30864]|uniref:GTPase-activating Rap/Ran-GAP domain-like protein 3 n=1 Tax=Capsaspora owczarzaki (strain ATCC 30864) TaxID=595528 RepID=A0A0D2X4N7_CAPO3|nr:hypothetical protein CAOG_06714 [Capsaspora owczarzaki ATCC 30864]KJE96379.1 hypothetical protein CAOG_006714 [Capsaspora owczarzaki ATCC 30864]|eukprot:XP_004344335.2 hypothetical protein CAOG_06714 [Capsaspora owczarzaki ATCC 30864]
MATNLVKRVPGYRFEDGSSTPATMNVFQHLVLEDAEGETRWYFKYFLGHDHKNIIGLVDEKPFLVSAVLTDQDNNGNLQWRLIRWRKEGSERLCLPFLEKDKKELASGDMLKVFGIKNADKVKEVLDPDVQEDLLVLEEQEGAVNFKFGILYAKPGQRTDDEMFSNNDPSPAFNEFVEALGTKVDLKGFDKFRGGLDVKTGTTGTHSIWTSYHGHQIMFHVSTMLPFSADNAQQLERKRHLGNDIVTIVFVDGDASTPYEPLFDPDEIKSHFIHVNAIVRYDPSRQQYLLNMATKDCVNEYGPPLPNPAVFSHKADLREFLLVKLMNGEKASYSAPVFLKKMERTLDTLLGETQKKFMAGNQTPPVTLKMHEVGQILRVKRIQSGLAPTSRVDAGSSAWAPVTVVDGFSNGTIVCGALWGERVVIATTAGVFVTHGDLCQKIIDKQSIVQLTVIERPGLLICRSNKSGKGGHVYVFPLDLLLIGNAVPKGRCKKFKIGKSSDCHLYAVGEWETETHFSGALKLCVAVRNRVLVFEHIGPVVTGQFKMVQELLTPDPPSVISFCDNNNRVVVGFRTEFDLITLKGSQIRELFVADGKVNPLQAIPVDNEVLLCYNHLSVFKDFVGKTSRNYDLKWTAVPSAVAYHVPFVCGFAAETIEIRTLINGKLVASVPAPGNKYLTTTPDAVLYTTTVNGRVDIVRLAFDVWLSSA